MAFTTGFGSTWKNSEELSTTVATLNQRALQMQSPTAMIMYCRFNSSGRESKKSWGTSFIGMSPEFEMAVYSNCFLVGKEDNTVELDTGTDLFSLNIKQVLYNGERKDWVLLSRGYFTP